MSLLADHNRQLAEVNQLLSETPEDADLSTLKKELEQLIDLETQLNTQNPTPSTTAPDIQLYTLNSLCNAQWTDGEFYSARILSINDQYEVLFLQYNEKCFVSSDKLRPYVVPSIMALRPNTAVWVIDPSTQLMVEGFIVQREDSTLNSERRYVVRLRYADGQKKKLTVPANHIQLNTNFVMSTESEFHVPASLQVNPSDSEIVKQQKLKQIKRLKSQYKQHVKDAETSMRVGSWQSFKAEQSKKRKGVNLSAVIAAKRPSMFKTSANARVGVVKHETIQQPTKSKIPML